MTSPTAPSSLTLRRVVQTWWPLAGSWALMTVEMPALSAIVARLPDAEIHLAAWGGIVFPFVMLVSSPIMMLLSASTALSVDRPSYLMLRRFMHRLGFALTLIHALVVFTPLYYVVARYVFNTPPEILAPGRIGLMLTLPWTWAIAYRRLHQGVMIRFGHTQAVGWGTLARLFSNLTVLLIGYSIGTLPGIVVASGAIATGVMAEALYAGLRARPILRHEVAFAPRAEEPLTFGALLNFYVPLVLTSLLHLLVQPIGSAAMSRMPMALESLATWSVLNGLIFVLRSPGLALNETVVALLDEPGARHSLRRFALLLAAIVIALTALLALTPLARVWFEQLMALPSHLATLGRQSLYLSLPLPLLVIGLSWYQGTLLNAKHTRPITVSVGLYLGVTVATLGLGIVLQRYAGLLVASLGFTLASVVQVVWLRYSVRKVL